MNHGTKVLKELLKKVENMTVEEYNELYGRALKDIEEIERKHSEQFVSSNNRQDSTHSNKNSWN
jgi:hypothetical protein